MAKVANRGEPEKLTAAGKERAIITEVGKRSDVGWESRGWKFTQDELSNPPSLRDNMLISEEMEYRKKAHTFIFDCCQLLRAKALVIAAAMTICQRYFSQVSFRKIDRSDTAAAAIFLASKVEEFRVHIKDVMRVTHKVRHKGERNLVENSEEYVRYKERLLKAENQLVNALGFDFMIEHPFGHASDLVSYLAEEGWVPADKSALISKGSHHLLIKSLRGTMCLEHPPNFRARLVTYLSLLVNNISPPPGGWAEMIEFEDHRRLNRAACQLLDTLDDDPGKTGRKITKKRVAAALVEAGHIKTKNGPDRVPRQPPVLTYADRDRMSGKPNGSAAVPTRSGSPHGRSYPNGATPNKDRPSPTHEPSSHGRSYPHRRSSSGDRPPPPTTGKRPRTEDAMSNGSASKARPQPPPPRHSSGSSGGGGGGSGGSNITTKPRPPPPRPSSTNGQHHKPRPPPPRPSSSNGQSYKPRPPPPRPSSGGTTGASNYSKPKPPPPTTPRPTPPATGKRPRTEDKTSNGMGKSSTPRPRPPPPRPSSTSTPSKPKAPPRPPSTPHPDFLKKKQTSAHPTKPSGGSGGSAPVVLKDGGAAQGKRSREERAEGDLSAEPGSGGKRSRTLSSGDVKETGPASTPIEDGEVEDGELPIKAAAVPMMCPAGQ